MIKRVSIHFTTFVHNPILSFWSSLVSGALGRLQTGIILLMLGSALLCFLRFDDIPVGSFFDDAHYIVLAESLAAGKGYKLINFPQAPVETAFPPGWPLLIAPVVSIFPDNFTVLKLVSLFFWLASIPLVVRLFAVRLNSGYLLALGALVSLNPLLIGTAATVMSEAAYLFFSLLTLNLFDLWRRDRAKGKLWLLAVIVLLASYTMVIRTIGVTLLLALLLFLLLHQRRRYLSVFVSILILAFVPLFWFNSQNGGVFVFSSSYNQHFNYITSHLKEFLQIWSHLPAISAEIVASSLLPVFDLDYVLNLITPTLNLYLATSFLIVVLIGYVLSLRSYQPLDSYVALYMSVLYFWFIYTQEVRPRMLVPVIPFLYFYVLVVIHQVGNYLDRHSRTYKTSFVFTALVGILFILLARNYHEWRNPISSRVIDLSVGASWLRENSPSDSQVMTINPVPDYLYLRRQTLHYPGSKMDIARYVVNQRVDYILVRPHLSDWDSRKGQLNEYTATILLPFLETNSDKFREVYRNADHSVSVYQVVVGKYLINRE